MSERVGEKVSLQSVIFQNVKPDVTLRSKVISFPGSVILLGLQRCLFLSLQGICVLAIWRSSSFLSLQVQRHLYGSVDEGVSDESPAAPSQRTMSRQNLNMVNQRAPALAPHKLGVVLVFYSPCTQSLYSVLVLRQ